MKKIIFTLSIMVAGFAAMAQDLAPDQNPNYKISMDKYATGQLALQTTNNTTIQDTYKAYDWSTAKAERKAERRSFRRERRLNNSLNLGLNYGWNNNRWSGNWNNNNNNWNNNYNNGWNNGWNSFGWNNGCLIDDIFRLFW
jgi:hypothetical protein